MMKHVIVYKGVKQIKKFDCLVCDLSDHVIHFYGVTPKRTNSKKDITIQYVGNSYVEIDHIKRECIVIPDYPDIQLFITW